MNERGERPVGDRWSWFPADVYLRDTGTGERRTYRTWETLPDAEGLGGVEFSWGEHNDSCDCNRALYFARAAGIKADDPEAQCGDGRYVVDKIVNADTGAIMYTEDASTSER